MGSHHPFLTEKIKIIEQINDLDSDLKNTIINFLFVFNIFESEFFEEPKWVDFENSNKTESKSVRERANTIQEFFITKGYPLDFLGNLEKLRTHFCKLYVKSTTYSEDITENYTDRYKTFTKTSNNKNGFDEKEMKRIYLFLGKSFEKNKQYSVLNALMLCYKFRNNMFHGNKDITGLSRYKEEFQVITEFMISLMKQLNNMNAERF